MDTRSLATLDDYSKFHQNTTPALLSENIACFVSTAASATRLSLKATQALTDLIIEAAKYGTSASLGISRRALVQAISTARYLHVFGKNDLAVQAVTDDVSDLFLQTLEKYTNYGISIIHHTFSLAELFALAGFHITARVVTGGLMAAEESVRVLDGLFGSTETSRALAAVVHLVRREIYEDEDFKPVASLGKLAVLARITTALTAYACLQTATHSRSMNRVRMTLLYRGEVPIGVNFRPAISSSSASPCHPTSKDIGAIPISVRRTATLSSLNSRKPFIGGESASSESQRRQSAPLRSLIPERSNTPIGRTGPRRSGTPYFLKPPDRSSTTSISVSGSGSSTPKNMNETSSPSQSRYSNCRKTNIPRRVFTWQESSGSETCSDENGKAYRNSPKRYNENASSPPGRLMPTPKPKCSPGPGSCNNCIQSKASKSLSLLFNSMNRQLLASSQKKVRVKVHEVKSTRITEHCNTNTRSLDVQKISPALPALPSIPPKAKPTTKLHTISTEVYRDPRRNTPPTQYTSESSDDGRTSPFAGCVPSTRPSPTRSVSPMHAKRKRNTGEFFPHYPHFPELPFLQNLWRFLRYSTAAYGATLMSLVGVGHVDDLLHLPARIPAPQFLGSGQCGHHRNHHAFARHTSLPVASILLSSFTTPGNGGSEAENPSKAGSPDATPASLLLTPPKMHALVHYVVVDHMACAIVLTCRGTLGLSDLLTDATCSYEELSLHGEKHWAHAGILRSARMLGRTGGEAMRTLKKALEEYQSYGLVLTGHSLGGAVAAMLAMLWSEPVKGVQEEGLDDQAEYKDTNGDGTETTGEGGDFGRRGDRQRDHRHRRFVTSRESGLPPGRPVHCYGFGVPAVGSISLSRACLGLVTTVIHNTDIVPCLSLGLVRDFKNVAVSLWWEAIANPKRSKVSAEGIIRRALGVRRKQAASDCPSPAEKKSQESTEKSWEQESGGQKSENGDEISDEEWLWVVMKTLRANMSSEKLVPPGAVFIVSSHLAPNDAIPPSAPSSNLATSFLQRSLGLPSPPSLPNHPTQIRRATLHRVEDVEVRFSEIHFSKSMFSDHSPKGYEEAVGCLLDGWKPNGTEEKGPVRGQFEQ